MRIAIGCDHGAFALKNKVIEHLEKQGHEVRDFGTYSTESCDYPDFAAAASVAYQGYWYKGYGCGYGVFVPARTQEALSLLRGAGFAFPGGRDGAK